MDSKTMKVLNIFVALFFLGLILILFSSPLGEILSRHYEGSGIYSFSPDEVMFKAISFIICGGILSLVSGFGSVMIIIKKYLD